MLKLKLVQLDDRGNLVNSYSNATLASKCNNIKQPAISRCCNNISKMIRNEETKNNAMFVNGFCYVKYEDWTSSQDKIKWLLTKNDIFCINDKGEVVYTYKTVIDTFYALSGENSNANIKVSIYRVLNDKDQAFKGYRLATREHYNNMINENPNYYKEDYGRRNKIILYKKNELNNDIEEIREFYTLEETARYMNCAANTIRYALKNNTRLLKTDLYLKYGQKIPFYTSNSK